MRRFWGLVVLVALLLAACSTSPTPALDPNLNPGFGVEDAIPGQYIVVLNQSELSTLSTEDFELSIGTLAVELGVEAELPLQIINGFVATNVDELELRRLQQDPRVAYLEPDRIISIESTTQTNATWGIDRIDQRDRPLDRSYTYNVTGKGVNVYILDTGIRSTHQEFSGRVRPGYTVINDGNGTNDCRGHGTHVAGTVGGTVYGVAKEVNLYPVRVLDCNGSGTISGAIAGINWVTNNHIKPAVANMSLGGGISSTLDNALRNSIAAGVIFAVAAGNSNADACNYSPAREPLALTVGATVNNDSRSPYSNFGPCIDLFAPGSGVFAADYVDDNSITFKSGTSMASPHVAGAAALYLQVNPTAKPAEVFNHLVSNANLNKLSDIGAGSPNRLLYMGDIGAGAPTPPSPSNQAPTASITAPNSGATFIAGDSITFSGSGNDLEDGNLTGSSLVWTSSRDGQIGTGSSFSRSNLSTGTHTITLTVKDSGNLTGTASVTLTVNANRPPVASILSPDNGASFTLGESVSFSGLGSDPDGDPVTLSWSSSSGQSGSGGSFTLLNPSAGSHSVTLTARDSRGATGMASVTLTVSEPAAPPAPEPDPEPAPAPSEPAIPCDDCDTFDGTLETVNAPLEVASYASASGAHQGWLQGPASGADFTLELQRVQGKRWVTVAIANGSGATKEINYSGGRGEYRWVVYATKGNGAFTVFLKKP